jgi:phospholipid/cholesterol/gamma-HCH transport system ATP-binding protein
MFDLRTGQRPGGAGRQASVIRFEHVSKSLGGKRILEEIDLEIETGETFVIVGPSGAGKSVTLKHMVRLLAPDQGRVLIDEDNIALASGSELERIRRRFGMLFQGGALLAWLSVTENVALPLREKTGMSNDEILDRVHETLKLVGLENDGNKMPSDISGGMKKRAGVARAIVMRPEIVLYDEPTSGLDPVTSRTIDALIERMREEIGVTSVVVSHDLHSALSIGSRIAMLFGGRITELADPAGFIRSPREEVRQFLESQFITRKGAWEEYLA